MFMISKLSSRQIIAANLKELMLSNKHSEGDLHRKTGLSQSTIGRVLKCETSATVDTLETISKVYGLQAWQIMIADLDVSNPPVLKAMSDKEKLFYEKMKDLMQELK